MKRFFIVLWLLITTTNCCWAFEPKKACKYLSANLPQGQFPSYTYTGEGSFRYVCTRSKKLTPYSHIDYAAFGDNSYSAKTLMISLYVGLGETNTTKVYSDFANIAQLLSTQSLNYQFPPDVYNGLKNNTRKKGLWEQNNQSIYLNHDIEGDYADTITFAISEK